MTTFGSLSVNGQLLSAPGHRPSLRGYLWRLRANWPALLLPLVTVGALAVIHGLTSLGPGEIRGVWPVLLIAAAGSLAFLAPEKSARIAPFAVVAYSALGIYQAHVLLVDFGGHQLYYGLVHVSGGLRFSQTFNVSELHHLARSGVFGDFVQVAPGIWRSSLTNNGQVDLVLAEALAFLAAGAWLLARTGAPGGDGLRRAVAQLRGTVGQPRTVPPLLLLPVIFLWEELFGQHLWFGQQGGLGLPVLWAPVIAALIFAAGAASVVWLPRTAAMAAVAGMMLFGLCGVLPPRLLTDAPALPFYGGVVLDGGVTSLFAAAVQGLALLGIGCALAPRLLTWDADHQLAQHAQALARRVDGLTRTRSDATEAAVAELRRIERDLHDGAQARLVAVGMSLRAAEQLMIANPAAALALVAEARETSSRAIDDLRDLVRGIYPPVLADRGLADAVRAVALDAVLDMDVDVDLPGEPPMPVAAAVYFAVAEALTNAARHAGACTVQVRLEHFDGMLRATVTDDGHGGADAARGTGLAGVERRLATFDGILAVSSPVGGPTIVAIEVPCALSSVKISSC